MEKAFSPYLFLCSFLQTLGTMFPFFYQVCLTLDFSGHFCMYCMLFFIAFGEGSYSGGRSQEPVLIYPYTHQR